MAGSMGSMDRNLALSLHSGSGLLVEGEKVKWINSKDSKPTTHAYVIVSDGDDVFMAVWNGDFWYNEGCAVYVTHWMELPGLPK